MTSLRWLLFLLLPTAAPAADCNDNAGICIYSALAQVEELTKGLTGQEDDNETLVGL